MDSSPSIQMSYPRQSKTIISYTIQITTTGKFNILSSNTNDQHKMSGKMTYSDASGIQSAEAKPGDGGVSGDGFAARAQSAAAGHENDAAAAGGGNGQGQQGGEGEGGQSGGDGGKK